MAGKRYAVIVNPRGGRRQAPAVLETVRPVFAAAGAELDVHVTRFPGHAAELARALDLNGRDGICVVGGDGTLHEVANGLLQRAAPVPVPLGLIPAGTGNSVAEHLGCSDPVQAAQRIVSGRVQPLDVARVTTGGETVYCVNIVGWGGAVDINCTAERLRVLGPARYAIAALLQIAWPRHRRARLTLDGQVTQGDYLFIAGCNTHFTGKGMKLAPEADIGDGRIDVVFARRASRLQMLKLFRRLFNGTHMSLSCVECRRVRSFAIESDSRDLLNLDGELRGTTPVAAEVMPGALRIFG